MSRPDLRLVPDEPDQVVRLREFRAAYPHVIIGAGGFGTWQARIPEPDGETVATRYTLRELLDRLDELTAGRRGDPDKDLTIRAANPAWSIRRSWSIGAVIGCSEPQHIAGVAPWSRRLGPPRR